MKYILACAILFLPFLLVAQTCIIAKKTKDAIFIGADSRATNNNIINGIPRIDTFSMCKIFTEGKYNFAISGWGSNASPSHAREACKKGGSFNSVINNYISTFKIWLRNDLNRLRARMSIRQFDSLYNNYLPYYNQVIFWGVESDTLYLGQATFILSEKDQTKINIAAYFAQGTVFAIGHTDHIMDKVIKPQTWRGNAMTVIKSLIKIEVKKHPKTVGGRIHQLKFTKKGGLMWLNGKKYPCA